MRTALFSPRPFRSTFINHFRYSSLVCARVSFGMVLASSASTARIGANSMLIVVTV
jgi:hypothetical protein